MEFQNPKIPSLVLFDTLVEEDEGTYDMSSKYRVLCSRLYASDLLRGKTSAIRHPLHWWRVSLFPPFCFGIVEKGHPMEKYEKALRFEKNDGFAIPFRQGVWWMELF